MPAEGPPGDLTGPARSELWDVALGELARHSYVELGAVVAELDERLDAEITEAEVRAALEDGLVRRRWLRRHDEERDVWLPGDRAYALLDRDRGGQEPGGFASAPSFADAVAGAMA